MISSRPGLSNREKEGKYEKEGGMNMEKKFAFVLWNPKTKKVSMDIFKGKNIKEAMEACVQFYERHGNWILSMCEIPT